MSSNKLTQSLLVVIAILLAWLAIRPYFSTTIVQASTAVQYKVANVVGDSMEQQLNELGKDGWSLVTCPNGLGPCIFKK